MFWQFATVFYILAYRQFDYYEITEQTTSSFHKGANAQPAVRSSTELGNALKQFLLPSHDRF